ncbi:hypothetical protein A4A49_10207 [Nicotiana attenuata]|uniref:Uncharacterized protein n=1 Tax=Nicotiana attenuata TaxID=49451 RepID=A0A1J6I6I8_NICAT|nr:hypothetical protein A4A49_10207 [Nicotiana attenuata]
MLDSLEIPSRVDLTAFQFLNIANQRIANKKPTYHNNKKTIKDDNIKDKLYKGRKQPYEHNQGNWQRSQQEARKRKFTKCCL